MNTAIIKNDIGIGASVQMDDEPYNGKHKTILNGKDITELSKDWNITSRSLQQKVIDEIFSPHFQVDDEIPCKIIKYKNFYSGWVEDFNYDKKNNRAGIVLFLFGKKTSLDDCIRSLSMLEKVNLEAFRTEYKLKVK